MNPLLLAFSIVAPSVAAFDYYVLALSWQPQFCKSQHYVGGCQTPTEYMKYHPTIHGLWPNYNNASFPSFCTKEKLRQDTIHEIGKDTIDQHWPDVKTNYSTRFIAYEWAKHGTCSDLNQLEYVRATIDLAKALGTPSVISNNLGQSVSTDAIRWAYGGQNKTVALVCSGPYLSEVRTCHDKSMKQIPCPVSVIRRDNCKSNTTKIRRFDDDLYKNSRKRKYTPSNM
jgi:ribonuclease T2